MPAEEVNVIPDKARQARNPPGRKTDVLDAAWMARLGAQGLVRPPPSCRRRPSTLLPIED
ncbi:hypothetical protein AV521_05545 [Streptomyces sp. IMTB 2501]|uniref:hypothetical protein n=1 Tax=Streptomyces sp. IMTB 2501 TaxID=1776340 RepID=UPI00096E69DC|nr:hypothetical protein AV521_05545 [Streptomyces sp. IMTB 2501]